MGKEKTTTTVDQTQKAEATPEEQELNRLALERARATQGGQIQAQQQGLNLVNQLLAGQALPGALSPLSAGLSPEVISDISREAVADIQPSFQARGILDSGVAAEISGRVAGDVRRSAEEFNIGNMQNLLNLALGGQAQVQAPLLQQQAQLGGQLSGLRTFTGQSTQTLKEMNPFLKSFQTSLGGSLGSGSFGSGGGGSAQGAGVGQSFANQGNLFGAGGVFAGGCWVASEIFGGWYEPKTCSARYYVNNLAPKWFKDFYIKHGESIAEFISDKPILKKLLTPLFEFFALEGGRYA